jgi:hypothetical protein
MTDKGFLQRTRYLGGKAKSPVLFDLRQGLC